MNNAFANALMRSRRARPAQYIAPGGSSVSIRCVFEDSSAEVRVNAGVDVIADSAEGSVFESVDPEIGGIIKRGETEYEIRNIEPSSAPGLLELDLLRVAGEPIEAHNLSASIMRSFAEPVILDGHSAEARVSRRVKVIEGDAWQGQVIAFRTLFSVRNDDIGSAGAGSFIDHAGREYLVDRVMRDGTGITILVC